MSGFLRLLISTKKTCTSCSIFFSAGGVNALADDHNLLAKLCVLPYKRTALSAWIQICDDLLKNKDDGKLNCVIFLDIFIPYILKIGLLG